MKKKIKKIFKKPKYFLSKTFKLLKFYFLYFNKLTFRKTVNSDKRVIIIVFDGNFPHGGLVDRMKGIISFYQTSKELDATFKIYFKKPFDLSHFLIPNEYDWVCDSSDLSWNPLDTKVLYLMLNFNFDPVKYISKSKKKKFIVFCNIDYSKSIYPQNSIENNELQWGKSFNQLFKKSNYLSNEFSKLAIKSNSIAFHTRFTTLFGDFKDSTKRVATETQKEAIKNLLLKAINTIVVKDVASDVYVFSDSIQFLTFIKNATNFIVLEGNPKHIDESENGSDLQNHIKTFVDFFALSECSKVYLLHTEGMSGSGFSKYAAMVGNTKFEQVSL